MSVEYSLMVDYDNSKTFYKYCVECIKSIKNKKMFYIGATSNCENRVLEHKKDKNMQTMMVLCKVPTKNKTSKLESKLIKRFASKLLQNIVKYDESGNIIQDGGGNGLIDGINYIYVLFK